MRFKFYMTMINLLILFFYYSSVVSPYNKNDHNKILWDRRRLKKKYDLVSMMTFGGKIQFR